MIERLDLTTDEQVHALRELLQSNGWKLFLAHVDDACGDKQTNLNIRQAMKSLQPGDEDGERMTTLQILAAQSQAQSLIRWPAERIRTLSTDTKVKGPFAALRR